MESLLHVNVHTEGKAKITCRDLRIIIVRSRFCSREFLWKPEHLNV